MIKKVHLPYFSMNFLWLELIINLEKEHNTIMRRDKGTGSVVANKEHPKTYRKHAEKNKWY